MESLYPERRIFIDQKEEKKYMASKEKEKYKAKRKKKKEKKDYKAGKRKRKEKAYSTLTTVESVAAAVPVLTAASRAAPTSCLA